MRKPFDVSNLPNIDNIPPICAKLWQKTWYFLKQAPFKAPLWLKIYLAINFLMPLVLRPLFWLPHDTLFYYARLEIVFIWYGVMQIQNLLYAYYFRKRWWVFILTFLTNPLLYIFAGAPSVIYAVLNWPYTVLAFASFAGNSELVASMQPILNAWPHF